MYQDKCFWSSWYWFAANTYLVLFCVLSLTLIVNNKVSYHIIKKFHNNSSDNDSKVAEYRSVCVHMERF